MSRERWIELIGITIGVLMMSAGFYFYMVPYNLITGGFSGIGIIITKLIGTDIAILIYIMNFVALLLGWMVFGKQFLSKTIYGSILFPFGIQIFQWMDVTYKLTPLTNDILLAVIYSGLLVGVGLGVVLRLGGTTGGMDIFQKIMNKKMHIPFSVAVYGLDGLVVLLGAIFFGFEIGMYSVLSLLIIGRVIDWTIIAGKSTKSVYVITRKADEVKSLIFERVYRGITEIDIVGGYTGEGKVMLLCVVTNRQYYSVLKAVHEVDPDAFVFANNSSEVVGAGFNGYHSVY